MLLLEHGGGELSGAGKRAWFMCPSCCWDPASSVSFKAQSGRWLHRPESGLIWPVVSCDSLVSRGNSVAVVVFLLATSLLQLVES